MRKATDTTQQAHIQQTDQRLPLRPNDIDCYILAIARTNPPDLTGDPSAKGENKGHPAESNRDF